MIDLLSSAPREMSGKEQAAAAEGLAGETDSGIRGDFFAALLQLAGGAEDPQRSCLSDLGDREEDAKRRMAEDVRELLDILGRNGRDSGLDWNQGAGLDADELQVGELRGCENGSGRFTQWTGDAVEAAAREKEGRGRRRDKERIRGSAHEGSPFDGIRTSTLGFVRTSCPPEP
jgi:hypothetical protein